MCESTELSLLLSAPFLQPDPLGCTRDSFNTDLDSGPDFIFEFSRCLGIDPPRKFSLIYVAFVKAGPLGTFLGPTLADNRPTTEKQSNIHVLVSCSESLYEQLLYFDLLFFESWWIRNLCRIARKPRFRLLGPYGGVLGGSGGPPNPSSNYI